MQILELHEGRLSFRQISRAVLASMSALLLATASSCTVGPTGPELEATPAQREDGLAAYPGFSRWPNNVGICFSNGLGGQSWGDCSGTLANASFDTLSASLFSSLQATWDSASALTFSRSANCAPTGNPPAGTIRIKLTNGYCGGVCGGNGSTGNCLVSAGDMSSTINRIAVHEVGHGLGFAHEHQRGNGSTWEVSLCPAPQATYDEDTQVIAKGSSLCFNNSSHAASNPIVVNGKETCPAGSHLVTLSQAQENNSNIGAVSLSDLTAFDPLSVMNYCNVFNGRQSNDASLTPLDALGVEIMYPYSLTRTLAVGPSATFAIGSLGDALVARDDAQVLSDWSSRGAADAVFANNQWHVDNVTFSTQPRLALSTFTAGAHTIRFSSIDVFGRTLSGSLPQTLSVNTGLHTAILLSTLF